MEERLDYVQLTTDLIILICSVHVLQKHIDINGNRNTSLVSFLCHHVTKCCSYHIFRCITNEITLTFKEMKMIEKHKHSYNFFHRRKMVHGNIYTKDCSVRTIQLQRLFGNDNTVTKTCTKHIFNSANRRSLLLHRKNTEGR